MKKIFVLAASMLLLASCSGNNGSSSVIPSSEVTETDGEARIAAINENMETSLGNKCVDIVAPIVYEKTSVEQDGVTVSIDASSEILTQYDLPDNVAFMSTDIRIEMGVAGYGSFDTDQLIEIWMFGGKTATRTTVNATVMGTSQSQVDHQVADSAISAKEAALSALVEIGTRITSSTWSSVTYYAGEGEGDLRVVAKDGTMSGTAVSNYEVTYVSGLPQNVVISQSTSIATVGMELNGTTNMTFAYPDSLSITTPDLSSSEWSSAAA